jgi:hypothetical protein
MLGVRARVLVTLCKNWKDFWALSKKVVCSEFACTVYLRRADRLMTREAQYGMVSASGWAYREATAKSYPA